MTTGIVGLVVVGSFFIGRNQNSRGDVS